MKQRVQNRKTALPVCMSSLRSGVEYTVSRDRGRGVYVFLHSKMSISKIIIVLSRESLIADFECTFLLFSRKEAG